MRNSNIITCQVERCVWLARRPMHGVKKKSFFILTNLIQFFFFTSSKLRVHNTWVLNCISVACVWKFPIVYKIVIKNKFFWKFFLFHLVHSTLKIFLYHLWNFHSIIINRILFMYFSRKCRLNIYLIKKLYKIRNFKTSFKLFFSKTKYLI